MIPQKRFKLTRQAMLLATISAAFPVTGYCIGAGQVVFVTGNVESVSADGSRHPLSKGADINAGEAINTAAGARAQVRFADGGFISLQPNTLFRVDEFNFKGKADGQEKGFFSLLKGGLRAITGLIGHVNRDTYRVTTPAATIGIRGTGYNAVLRDDGLFVNVGEGAISLNNNAGLLVVTAGGAAFVADFNTSPKPTTEQPQTPPASLQQPATYIASDQRNSSGGLTIISLPSGPGYSLAYVSCGGSCFDCGTTPGSNGLTGVTATFTASSQLVAYDNGYGKRRDSARLEWSRSPRLTASSDGGDGTVVKRERIWYQHPGNHPVFDYVVGIPTAAMPTTGTATYSLMGYTSPTATDGSTGYSVNGTLSANFGAGNIGVSMSVANSANSYAINTLAVPHAMNGATFSGSAGTTSATGCFSGCSTSINGFFAGVNASRAGVSYSITGVGVPELIASKVLPPLRRIKARHILTAGPA